MVYKIRKIDIKRGRQKNGITSSTARSFARNVIYRNAGRGEFFIW